MDRHQGARSMMPDSQNIWNEVQNGLRAFIAKRVTNDAEVDDIVQDVWLKMQRGLDGLQDQRRLISWIYQIARHAIIDHYRAPGRRREMPAGLAADLEAYQSSATMTTISEDSGQLRKELAGCLRPMIERLSEEYRQAVTLVDLEGITQQAAAVQLGLSLSGMKSRVQRGRRQLRKMLEACCTIELDQRRGVVDYDVRDQQDKSCRTRPDSVSAIPVKRENPPVALVHLVSLAQPNKPNKQDKPAEPALSYSLDFSDELMNDLR